MATLKGGNPGLMLRKLWHSLRLSLRINYENQNLSLWRGKFLSAFFFGEIIELGYTHTHTPYVKVETCLIKH